MTRKKNVLLNLLAGIHAILQLPQINIHFPVSESTQQKSRVTTQPHSLLPESSSSSQSPSWNTENPFLINRKFLESNRINKMMNQDHILRASQDDEMESLVLHDDGDGGNNSSGNLPQQQPKSPESPFNSFLDPPSYAEAIFTSFDSNGHDQTLEQSTRSGSESECMQISVSDPQEEQELTNSLVPGGSSYHTYLITTRTDKSEFGVRRRFREVVTLSERLSEAYRGYVIPVRPEKSSVERKVMQKEEFVEQRRVALEKYLRKLASHPVIGKSEELRLFLEGQGKLQLVRSTDVASRMLDGAVRLPRQLFGSESVAVDLNDVAQPARSGRDLLRIFKELKQSVTNDWTAAKPLVVEEDKEFMEKKDKLMEFEQQLSNVSQQVVII